MQANGVAIEFEGVYKQFDQLEVLKGMGLLVRWGEVTTILGPSGCGKSVTLKHIIGIERADRGRVEVAGHVRRLVDVGYVRFEFVRKGNRRVQAECNPLFDDGY